MGWASTRGGLRSRKETCEETAASCCDFSFLWGSSSSAAPCALSGRSFLSHTRSILRRLLFRTSSQATTRTGSFCSAASRGCPGPLLLLCRHRCSSRTKGGVEDLVVMWLRVGRLHAVRPFIWGPVSNWNRLVSLPHRLDNKL